MNLDTTTLVLLAVVAGFSVLQGLLLVGAAWQGMRAVRRSEAMASRLGRELRPAVHELTRAARDLADVSDLAVAQARQLDDIVAETVRKVERTQDVLRDVVLPSAGRVAAAATAVRLLRAGYGVVKRLRR
jgi:hypothetical protein